MTIETADMRKYLTGILILFFFIGVAAWLSRSVDSPNELPVVAITQIATHPALDEVRRGIIRGLEEQGFKDGLNIKILFRNANGDPSLTLPIAQEFVRIEAAVVVPISTPSALGVAKSTKTIPIVFSGVTDPVAVGLVENLNAPGRNITGVSDQWPFEAQVKTFLEIFPNVRRIGLLYTRGDDVSKKGVDALKELSAKLDFELELSPVSAPQDVYPAAVALLRRVDGIYTGIDHLLLENMEGLVKAANEAGKPLFGGESGSVEKGAVLALSINMTEFGLLTSKLIVRVLNGTPPGAIPVHVVTDGDLVVNAKAAKRFGLDLGDLKKRGARIIESE